MRNIRLKIAYDGSRYLGWQKNGSGPSIEGILEENLTKILQHPIELQAASRTDAGVHAHGQIVNCFTSHNIELHKLKHSLNCMLPDDIVVVTMEQAHDNFHPTIDCMSKEYHYNVCYARLQLPHQRGFAWHFPGKLNIAAIKEAIPLLVGEHDFTSFCNKKITHKYAHYLRQIESIEVYELPNECLRFEIRGNNFLYRMVRNIVGTLVFVGCSKISGDKLPEILMSGDRRLAGMSAPADGLFLHRVYY